MGIYLSAMAGSTGRERELAQVKALHEGHTNASCELLSALHELRMDGPTQEAQLVQVASEGSDVVLGLTELSKKLCLQWLQKHGRRFRLYKVRKDAGLKRGHRQGSEAALVAAQRTGRERLAKGEGAECGLLGVGKAELQVPARQRREKYQLSAMLTQFRKTTANRAVEKSQRKANVQMGLDPYPIGTVRLGQLFGGAGDDAWQSYRLGSRGKDILALNLSASELPPVPGARLVEAFSSKVKLVVVESECDLSHGGQKRGSTNFGRPSFPFSCKK